MFTLQLPQYLYRSKVKEVVMMITEPLPESSTEPQPEPPTEPSTPQKAPTVDLVLVYLCSVASVDENYEKIRTFLVNLERQGLQLQTHVFSLNDDINFIIIHAPRNVLLYYSDFHNIVPYFKRQRYRIQSKKPLKFMTNELTLHNRRSPNYHRAPETFSGQNPVDFTTSERALIIYKILTTTEYGRTKTDYGIERLLYLGVFDVIYPVHDGPYKWTDEGDLNDRQILDRYWANIKSVHKQQPLDLIEKYLGTEFGFFFAWVGFYNRFLLFSSIIGVLFFFIGLFIGYNDFIKFSREICNSNKLICPQCYSKNCKFESLANSCIYVTLSYLFDNGSTAVFSIIMLILANVFLKYWNRQEFFLQLRWNLTDLTTDISPRPEYERSTKYRRISPFSNDILEPYVPIPIKCARITVTYSVIIFCTILMAFSLFGIIIGKQLLSQMFITESEQTIITKNIGLIATALGVALSVTLILICDLLYYPVAIWLTNLENPRTQADFDNSFIYKCYALEFINNYSAILYFLLIQGRLYTYPSDPTLQTTLGLLYLDICDPYGGCSINLTIQLIVTLIVKEVFILIKQYNMPSIGILLRRFKYQKNSIDIDLKQWESDYLLNLNDRYHLVQEYIEMVIQYGFVMFFIAAFPLAPLFAFLSNLIELRIDAYKLIRKYQRRIPVKIASLGAWNGILKGITYISVITNAFIIAFRSHLINHIFYQFKTNSTPAGYINWILSIFIVDYNFPIDNKNTSICYYPGMRYPTKHPKQYQLTNDFWTLFATKLCFVVVYELLVFMLMAIIVHWIPTISTLVGDYVPRKGSLPNITTGRTELKRTRRSF